jgi:sulfur carrier protein
MTSVAVTLNGERRAIAPGTTVGRLLEELGRGPRGVAVAVNEEMVPRSSWRDCELRAGDRVEVLRAAQGGC